jgi:hypothetical protein
MHVRTPQEARPELLLTVGVVINMPSASPCVQPDVLHHAQRQNTQMYKHPFATLTIWLCRNPDHMVVTDQWSVVNVGHALPQP